MRIRHDPDYDVSQDGTITNSRTGSALKPFPRGRSPHLTVDLPSGRHYVHQIVADHFIGARPTGLDVRHLDNDYTNNASTNLAYGTRSENVLDLRQDRTHCPHGHEFSLSNTYIDPNGWRSCRTCRKNSRRRYRAHAHPQRQA